MADPFHLLLLKGAAATGFSPAHLAGLQLWLRGDTDVLTDVDGVYQWSDQSGNGRHAVQATGAAKPALQASQQNGLPGVYFNTDDFLSVPHSAGLAVTDLTLFVALKHATSTANRCLLSKSNGGYPESFDSYLTNESPPHANFVRGRDGDYAIVTSTATLTNGAAHILVWQDSAKSVSARLNGANAGSGSTAAVTYTDGGSTLRIGRRADGATQYDGHLLEVLLYNSALSAGNVAAVESYLNSKWAVY